MKIITHSKSLPGMLRRTSARPACVETMEGRLLMSGTGFSSVWAVHYTGLPFGGVIRDSAGNLYGTTGDGGQTNTGSIYEVAKGSGKITPFPTASNSVGIGASGLVFDSAGNLYGTTESPDGNPNGSAIFEVAKGSTKVTYLANIDSTTIGQVYGSQLVVDSHGDLFGTATGSGLGGENGDNIFELAKGSSTVTIVASFDPDYAVSNPVIDANGNIFGTTAFGRGPTGPSAATFFEVVKGSPIVSTLAVYNKTALVTAPVIDSNGNLYATANPGYYTDGHGGGNSSVLEVVKGSGKITTLATFSSEVGLSSLVRDSSGNLYGTVDPEDDGSGADGSVFKVVNGSGKITTLATFTNGARPSALTLDSSGNLYGTTEAGANTIFEVAASSGKVATLATFGGLVNPSEITRDAAGNLYGVAAQEGTFLDTLFEVAAGTGATTTLATFNAEYIVPAGVFADSAGDLFGTLNPQVGGIPGPSTLFEVVKGSGKLTTLLTFNGNVQASSLVGDARGNLYGTLNPDDGVTKSTAFELAKGSTKFTTVATFSDNVSPSGLVIDSTGDLYGTTDIQFSNTSTVFEVVAGSGKIKTLATFTAGGTPSALLSLDSSGDVYGTLDQTNPSVPQLIDSTVFEVVKGSGKIKTLATFADQVSPMGVAVDSSGNLFGVAQSPNDNGFVYEVAKGSEKITTLLDFNASTGLNPGSALISGPGGTLFGSTSVGGPLGGGVVFKLMPT